MSADISQGRLRVTILVYDLLAGHLFGSLLNAFSSGFYHSSVMLTYTSARGHTKSYEFMYGAGESWQTGICLDVSTIQSLKVYKKVDCGEAFGKRWRRKFMAGSELDPTSSKMAKAMAELEALKSANDWYSTSYSLLAR